MRGTVLGLEDVEEGFGLDVADEAGVFAEYDLDDEFEEEADAAVEVVLDLGLGAEWVRAYRPGRCFCSRNHLLPYSPYLL